MTEVNVPLLRKAVEWVEEQDKLPLEKRAWVQEFFILREAARESVADAEYEIGFEPGCGTAYCVAGYIGQMLRPNTFRDNEFDLFHDQHVSDFAAEALGISWEDSEELFAGDNSAEDIRRIAERIAGQKL